MAMPGVVTQAYVKGQLYDVPLVDLQASPDQPRKFMDPQSMEELTASIVQHGGLEPILFRQDGGSGLLFVVAGERRCAAARKVSEKRSLIAAVQAPTAASTTAKTKKKPA